MPRLAAKILVTLLCFSLCSNAFGAAPKPHASPQETAKNQSVLLVSVGVKGGKLIVDRAKSASGFSPSDRFKQMLGDGLSEAEINKRITAFRDLLFDDLDEKFNRMQRIYEYALTASEHDQQPQDALTRKMRDFPGDGSMAAWETFAPEFDQWANSVPDRLILKQVFSQNGMLTDLNDVGNQTALIFKANFQKPPPPFNAQKGTIRFRVADPISKLDDTSEYVISFPNEPDPKKAESKRKNVLKLLASFSGQLWRPTAIREKIENFYAQRGLMGVVKISTAGKEPRTIEIPEAARIARILFSKDVPADSLDKLAYLLLSDHDFRAFVKSRPLVPITAANILAYQSLDYKDLGRALGTEPFLNVLQFQIQQLEISQLGFVAFQDGTPNDVRDQTNGSAYVDVYVNKTEAEEEGEKPANEPRPANPVPNDEGVLGARPEKLDSRTDFVPRSPTLDTASGAVSEDQTPSDSTANPGPTPSPGASPAPSPSPAGNNFRPAEKKNYLGFGVAYKPGQNVRLFGIFQRSRLGLLSGDDNIGIKLGAHNSVLGGLNYFADFVLFNKLHRRLSLQFSGNSNYVANRLFAGVKTDERRTGGVARAEMEVFRNRGGSRLRLSAEARHVTVDLIQSDHIVLKQNLSTLELGGLFMFENITAYRPKRFRLEPLLRIGVGLANNEPTYVLGGGSAGYHQQLPHFLELDLSGQFKFASSGTPIYELPSLGGAEILRGFREDDALGRRMWTTQNELWMPLPGTSEEGSGLQKFLRRQVRLAWFVDVGGIYGGNTDGMRAGPGVGARILYSPAIIKLDWAYGIGDAASTQRGHGRFYFSVGTNLPF